MKTENALHETVSHTVRRINCLGVEVRLNLSR